jgi:hypothetical protein
MVGQDWECKSRTCHSWTTAPPYMFGTGAVHRAHRPYTSQMAGPAYTRDCEPPQHALIIPQTNHNHTCEIGGGRFCTQGNRDGGARTEISDVLYLG